MKRLINTAVAATLTALVLTCAMSVQAAETAGSTSQTININTATVKELSFLPGVGASKAEAIVAYRTKRPFKKVEHIMKVKGIGRKSFKKMRPYLTLDGPTNAKRKLSAAK